MMGHEGACFRALLHATVEFVLRGDLIERAAAAGLRSLFVGFEDAYTGELASDKPTNGRNLGAAHYKAGRPSHSLVIIDQWAGFVFRQGLTTGRDVVPGAQ